MRTGAAGQSRRAPSLPVPSRDEGGRVESFIALQSFASSLGRGFLNSAKASQGLGEGCTLSPEASFLR